MDQVCEPDNLHKNLKELPEQMAAALQSFIAKSNSSKPSFMEGGFFIHGKVRNLVPAVLRIREKVRGFLEGTRACEIFDLWCEMIADSYILKLLCLSIAVNCIFPILAFVLFAVLSLVTTFTGFILLEGALLVLGACATVLWFGAIGIFCLLTAVILILLYLVYTHAGEIVFKLESSCFSLRLESTDDDDMVVVDNNHED